MKVTEITNSQLLNERRSSERLDQNGHSENFIQSVLLINAQKPEKIFQRDVSIDNIMDWLNS
jgi:hypothetical protein